MTQDEQKQFELLQSRLGKSNNEAQMYRSLFWILFLMTMVVTILHFFQA
jgi:hypothetical protein